MAKEHAGMCAQSMCICYAAETLGQWPCAVADGCQCMSRVGSRCWGSCPQTNAYVHIHIYIYVYMCVVFSWSPACPRFSQWTLSEAENMLRKLRKKGFGASSRSQTENFYSQALSLFGAAVQPGTACKQRARSAEEDNEKTAKKATHWRRAEHRFQSIVFVRRQMSANGLRMTCDCIVLQKQKGLCCSHGDRRSCTTRSETV